MTEATQPIGAEAKGGLKRITFSDLAVATEAPEVDLLALEEAMTALGRIDERFTRVVGAILRGVQPGGDRGAHRAIPRYGEARLGVRARLAVRAHDRLTRPSGRGVA